VKTTYISNMIKISIHKTDLKDHGVGFEGRSKNRQWSCREVERENVERKKVNRKKEKEMSEVFTELSSVE
jgi:hypothetical protein